MKLFLFVCLFSFSLEATCTNEQIGQAKQLYASAIGEKIQDKKIELLQKSLSSCYSPEIEANLFLLQAQHSKNINEQVKYYKKSLMSISKFQDKSIIIKYQNQINKKLAILLQDVNPKLSKMYHEKEMKEEKNPNNGNHIWIYIILGLLFLWGVYKNIKRHL